MTKQLSGFEKLKAKRAELNGGVPGDRFVWRADPNAEKGPKFAILNPYMLDDEAADEVAELERERESGELLPSELSEAMLDLFLIEEERDEFDKLAASGDMRPITLLNMILEEFKEKHTPTRRTSSRKLRQ